MLTEASLWITHSTAGFDELSAILSQPYRRATPRELALYALADRIRRAFEVCR